MAITAPQGVIRDAAPVVAATRVRWTYIAPSLLIRHSQKRITLWHVHVCWICGTRPKPSESSYEGLN